MNEKSAATAGAMRWPSDLRIFAIMAGHMGDMPRDGAFVNLGDYEVSIR